MPDGGLLGGEGLAQGVGEIARPVAEQQFAQPGIVEAGRLGRQLLWAQGAQALQRAAVVAVGIIAAAWAHNPDTSYARVEIGAQAVRFRFTYDLFTLHRCVAMDADHDGRTSRAELASALPAIHAFLRDHISVEIDDELAGFGTPTGFVWPPEAGDAIPAKSLRVPDSSSDRLGSIFALFASYSAFAAWIEASASRSAGNIFARSLLAASATGPGSTSGGNNSSIGGSTPKASR